MEDLSKHISELLFDHDCVIIPTLGGFLASNQPSRVLQPNQVIYPPYRRIAFNVYLKQNDGLLANHLVETENIPYSEAMRNIESFASDCFEQLDSGKKISLAEIGALYFDKEKNIQFEAFRNYNHLKESFGMDAIHFIPLQREDNREKNKSITEKTIRPSIPITDKEKRKPFNLSRNKKYIGAVLLVGGLIWFSVNLYFVAPQRYESTSLNPFDSQEIVLNKTDSLRNIPSTSQNDIADTHLSDIVIPMTPDETIASAETLEKDTLTINNNIKPEVKPEENIPPATTTTIEVEYTSEVNKNYIIAGVFKIKENALSMAASLQRLGFSNTKIIEANNRSYVAYEAFSKYSDAEALLDSLHEKNMEGWIWRH